MPIRMEEDPRYRDQNQNDNNPPRDPRRPRNTGGGGGGLASFLPMILMALVRKPKLLMGVLVIGGLLYMSGMLNLGGGGGGFNDGGNTVIDDGGGGNIVSPFSMGGMLDEKVYDKAEVYAALADNVKNPMPESVSLLKYAPSRGNQGRQGSCVGWSSAYAAQTIQYAQATGIDPDQIKFSPSYLYNQIALRGCQGTYIHEAMKKLTTTGGLPEEYFPYDERTCTNAPSRDHVKEGSKYTIKGHNRLSMDHDKYKTDMLAVKQHLAAGAPVVIGMQVGGTFMERMKGAEIWKPTQSDYNMRGFGGHAMCVIGYDDYKGGGAFQIMNSWGPEWGQNGIGWVRYKDFEFFNKEAYGLYPMGNAEEDKKNAGRFAAGFGLVNQATGQNVNLARRGNNVFGTTRPIRKGDKFKVEIGNTVESYIYIFGQETDGSSYVLFPYTPKHSPYCGIKGTRVFPRDYNLVADNIGNRDYIAVMVTKKPINYKAMNEQINRAAGNTYAEKVARAAGPQLVDNVNFQAQQGAVIFEASSSNKNIVAAVIEIDKQ